MSNTLKGPTIWAVLAGISVALIWSGWIIISRWGVQNSLSPSDLTLIRFGTASICTLPLWFFIQIKTVQWRKLTLIALGCGFPYTMLSFWGLTSIPAANAGVLVNGLLPVFSLLLTWVWLNQTASLARWGCVALLIVANGCMLSAGFTKEAISFSWLYLIGAAWVLTFYMVSVKRWQIPLLTIAAGVPSINTLLFLPVWLLSESHLQSASTQEVVLQIIYQGMIVSVAGLWLFSFCIKQLGAVTGSVIMAFVPSITALMGILFLGESLQGIEWVAVAMCTLGLVQFARSA